MKAKEFGSWASNKMSPGGMRKPGDEFNKSLKGQPYGRYKEYASTDIAEYHHYPEMKDLTTEEEEKKRQEQSSQGQNQSQSQSAKSAKARQSSSRLTRNLVSRFVAITAGAVVLVNTNPVLAERFPALTISSIREAVIGETASEGYDPSEQNPTGSVSASWTWSEDHESATLELSNGKGEVIARIPAVVDVVEDEVATCTAEGKKTYTAKAESAGTDYSDSYEETVDPLGHTFGEGKAIVLENGQDAMLFECENCHEQFTISTSIEKID